MKVYVLSSGNYSDWTIFGIYSSREKAETEKAEFEKLRKVDWQDELFSTKANPIEEFTLDERILCDWLYDHPWSGLGDC